MASTDAELDRLFAAMDRTYALSNTHTHTHTLSLSLSLSLSLCWSLYLSLRDHIYLYGAGKGTGGLTMNEFFESLRIASMNGFVSSRPLSAQ